MTPSSKLVIIPAPLHGRDMPRKLLRRLAGSPLLSRMIRIAGASVRGAGEVLVVTDDDEAALLAERMGCRAVVFSMKDMADGEVAWPQIYRCIESHESQTVRRFDRIALLKPDAPLLRTGDIAHGEELLEEAEVDSVIALGQRAREGGERRLPRDQERLTAMGAFAISKREAISGAGFYGQRVKFAFIPDRHAFEVRSSHDWWVCEKLLSQKRIVFVVAGYNAIGMGHVYRAQMLAHELMDHHVAFLCTRESELAAAQLAANKYHTRMQAGRDLAAEVLELNPDLVINDFLDTGADYILRLKARGVRVVNVEDMGSGAAEADLVINALYDHETSLHNHRIGPDYFCLRDEFLEATPVPFRPAVRQVLITFGGTDAPDLTRRILDLVFPIIRDRGIRLSIVTGPGYVHAARLRRRVDSFRSELVEIANGTKRMSEHMARADVAFSSAGRTVFELVTMRVPAIILAANEREETHTFASAANGLAYLGRHDAVADHAILRAFLHLIDDREARQAMHQRMQQHDFRPGKQRVIDEISKILYAPVEEENVLCPA